MIGQWLMVDCGVDDMEKKENTCRDGKAEKEY